jgi:hypothetical protein
MAEYAYVKDGQVENLYDLLPKTWNNVSGFELLVNDTETLKSLGWYKVNKLSDLYDPKTQRLLGYNYSFENDTVTETPNIINLSVEECEQLFQQHKSELLSNIKNQRDQKNKLIG